MGADQKRKEARKRKFGSSGQTIDSDATASRSEAIPAIEGSISNKKQKTFRTSAAPEISTETNDEPVGTTDGIVEVDAKVQVEGEAGLGDREEEGESKKGGRFIVFIGNLPFSATTASIRSHFSKVAPIAVRHSTDRATGRSKGFAFLEFEGYDRMKTCLKLYHHSKFEEEEDEEEEEEVVEEGGDVGEGAKKKKKTKKVGEARRLNVELTAGGGGKSKDRKAKLKEKNVKLNEERQRRAETEAKEAGKKMSGVKTLAGKSAGGEGGARMVGEKEKDGGLVEDESIHPSRRSRVPRR